MQRERVQDQYPWTWELPLVVICAVLLLGATVCQLGRSLANWFAGAGWWWPTYDKWVTSRQPAPAATPGGTHVTSEATIFVNSGGNALVTRCCTTTKGRL